MNNRIRISVCLASYNGEKYIYQQLNSILSQLSNNDEIIISDDNSSDKTLEIVKSFEDSRIKIFKNTGNKGYTSNFQNALLKAKGKYIFLSDQDDIWQKNKVEICLKYLDKYDFVVSDALVINDIGNIINDSFFNLRNPYISPLGNLFKFGYIGCCFTFKKDILDLAIPFPKNQLLSTHDNWLFLVACYNFKYKIIPDKLILYRRHDNNNSSGGLSNSTSFYFKIKYRMYLILNLINVFLKK